MIVFATSTVEIATLVIAAVAAVSSIGSAIVSGLFATRSEKHADTRAKEAEARAETRAKELEEREKRRDAERWRLERIRSAYDQCADLSEQGLSILQQFALSMPHMNPKEVDADRRALHPKFVALQSRIVLLGQDMNAIGEVELGADLGLGVATKNLVNSLNQGRVELAKSSATAKNLMEAYGVAESGLATFRLTMRGPLRGGD